MTMNEENCPPQCVGVDLSASSEKVGAAVFGNLVFGSEYPEHSLSYSPSPLICRRNIENTPQRSMDGRALIFDKSAATPQKPQYETPLKKAEAPKAGFRTAPQQKGAKGKAAPHQKNSTPAGLPRKRAECKRRGASADPAGRSVNPVINVARRSKEEKLKEKMLSVAQLREQRRLEREEVAAFNVEVEQTRRDVIELRKKLNERFRQAKVGREKKNQAKRLAKIENELKFKSRVHVEHKRTLKEQDETRRRMSNAAREKQRRNHREGEERMKLAAVREDQALFEERHESSVATRNAKADDAEKRRMSFAFRNGDARRIRELFAQREAEQMSQDHESYELKWAGERDADDYNKQMAEERRESFAFRNAEGKRIRDLESQVKAAAQQDEHESYELKWAGERDASQYKKEMDEERRDSFAFRNAEGQRIRDLEGDMKADAQCEEHESYELKWAGERDADQYIKQEAQKKRESFAFRNAEGKRIRDLESEMKAGAQLDAHESIELKWAGERDADDHRKQMDEERRDSFAFRNAEGRRIRDLEGQMKAEDRQNEHESYELKWAGERDAHDHKKKMDEERRDSFAFRNAEGRRLRDVEGEMRAEDLQGEHESYELKWAGERDADEYKKQMAQEKRDSFALRNAEGRRIRDVEGEMQADDRQNQHESYELKWAGERDADDYKKRMALEKRDSLVFRNAEGKRIRDLEGQMKAEDRHNEHESYELKWAGERDADNYKKQVAEERRDSLAFRNAEGKRIRDIESEMKAVDIHDEHESYELKWAGERDADDYKKQMAQERRDSFAFRNAEGNRIRRLESQMKSEALQAEHESCELKWAGERDAHDYKKQMEEERRKSLKFRNEEAARHDAVMKELLSLDQEREHESYMLKWAGEKDVKQYLADQAELRRESLAFRNAEGKRHRAIDEEAKAQKTMANAENEELNAASQRDVQQYKKECAAKERASLRLKGKEKFSSRLQAENDRQAKMEEDHESHLLDTAAWKDVNDYVKECNRRKRLSLAFRAKEKRHHFQVEKEQAQLKIHQRHLDTQYRSEDARYTEMARLKERARVALESFNRSPACTFGDNPFASLL